MTGKADEKGQKSDTALREEEVLKFWQEQEIFQKSLAKPAPHGEFVFYEGPPTANAKPALHHLEARAFKDAIPRYKTMQGYHVRRKAGWDTHGLPVELQIEKELGFTGKPDIEKYGVEAFNQKCRDSVLRYIDVWEQFTDRIGYWVDKSDAYYTFDAAYMESVWSIIAKVNADGRLYKDYKVLPWCSRCGTALSSHELAQGYKDVKDLSLTAMFELVDEPGTFVVAWTTTPWTLPGNVGLAVGKDIDYVRVLVEGQRFILAKERLSSVKEPYTIEQEFKGVSLAGRAYKPLYPYLGTLVSGDAKEKMVNAYKIYLADFVTTTDGTGIVHTAVMYGADDFDLGTKVGLPKFHLVKADGKFVEGTDFLAGRFVRDEDVAVDIIKDLAHRGLLFSKEKYEHTYPFCWRCSTPLIYYARDSWYIAMSKLRGELIAENQKINWEPAHIRDGRFGEWLDNVKDWALSRERYWGTPLPVWTNADGSERVVIGSVEELKKRVKKSGNEYWIMRHGEADHNVMDKMSDNADDPYHLTEKGRAVVTKTAEGLIDKIDLIVASPFVRAQETAELVASMVDAEVVTDTTIGDIRSGTVRTISEYEKIAHTDDSIFDTQVGGDGESLNNVRHRMGVFLYGLEQKYQNKKILIISHGEPLSMLQAVAAGLDRKKAHIISARGPTYVHKGMAQSMPFVPLPHNKDYELDLHKPYIDQVTLIGESGVELKRTPEVMDVWLDSGAMPFAQDHYPFNKDIQYPADFISEAIDQTRGWFYTLHAVGVLMGRGLAYKNVICLGHLLDDKGAKMSKSKGNVVEPFAALDEHGADLLRFWMYSVNPPGEGKNYDEKVLAEVKNKVFNPFLNSVQFYELYKDGGEVVSDKNVLDRWMQSRLAVAIQIVTESLDHYDMYSATREIRDLISDLSLWYVRRSRDRIKEDGPDAEAARGMLRHTLVTIAKMMAPFAPFAAEAEYQKLRKDTDPESVHLCDWPKAGSQKLEAGLLEDMAEVRRVVSVGLEKRQKAGIKVRQPLMKLTVGSTQLVGKQELNDLIRDEMNVKDVLVTEGTEVELDTTITETLREEGELRDLIREVQDLRKEAGLNPKDQAVLTVPADRAAFIDKHWAALAKATGLKSHEVGPTLSIHKS